MDVLSVLLPISIGLLLLMAELFFVPGTTVIGLIGFCLTVAGVGMGFISYGPVWGSGLAFGTLLLGLTLTYVGSKSTYWHKYALTDKLHSSIETPDLSGLSIGETGLTLSALRPSGKVTFGDRVFTVQTLGHLVPEGRRVSILKIEEGRIIVSEATA